MELRQWSGSGDEARAMVGGKIIVSNNKYLFNDFKQITV
jgi:hypothetical protein